MTMVLTMANGRGGRGGGGGEKEVVDVEKEKEKEKERGGGDRERRDCVVKSQLLVFFLVLGTLAWGNLLWSTSKNGCRQGYRGWQSPARSYTGSKKLDGELREFTSSWKNKSRGGNMRVEGRLELHEVVFGIGGSAQLWKDRKEFIKLWWKPNLMRGFVWLDEEVQEDPEEEESLPQVLVSEDTSRFSYTHALGHPSGIRISRVVSETFRLGLPNVKWFVMGDDDTFFNPDNLVRVLNKYDPSELYYIGNPSESQRQNAVYFSHNMAYGGGGFAISFPLAEAIARMQDACMERYHSLFGSDDRLHACISELGVPLTKEPGFHQLDLLGTPFGLLAAHPITPFLSMHHLQVLQPIIPGQTAVEGLQRLGKAMQTEPSTFLQNSMCYDQKRSISFSIASGFVVQVFPQILLPNLLQRSLVTFRAWDRMDDPVEFTFDTRSQVKSICKTPWLFFLQNMTYDGNTTKIVSIYKRLASVDKGKDKAQCWSPGFSPDRVTRIRVISQPLPDRWFQAPRRQCCRLTGMTETTLGIRVDSCKLGELLTG